MKECYMISHDITEHYHITCLTHLFHFFLTVNLHLGTAAGSEVDLSEWFQLPILGYQGMVSEEEKSRLCRQSSQHTHIHDTTTHCSQSRDSECRIPVRQLLLGVV